MASPLSARQLKVAFLALERFAFQVDLAAEACAYFAAEACNVFPDDFGASRYCAELAQEWLAEHRERLASEGAYQADCDGSYGDRGAD